MTQPASTAGSRTVRCGACNRFVEADASICPCGHPLTRPEGKIRPLEAIAGAVFSGFALTFMVIVDLAVVLDLEAYLEQAEQLDNWGSIMLGAFAVLAAACFVAIAFVGWGIGELGVVFFGLVLVAPAAYLAGPLGFILLVPWLLATPLLARGLRKRLATLETPG